MARTTRSIASGLELARCVHPFTEVGDGIFPRKLMEPRLANVNDEHAARHRPDVDRSIPPAAHYFSPKIGSSSLEYHVSGAGMLPGHDARRERRVVIKIEAVYSNGVLALRDPANS